MENAWCSANRPYHDGTGVVNHSTCGIVLESSPGYAAGEETTTVQHRMFQTQMNELGDERKKLFLVLVEIPIGPRNLIILAVRVIVACWVRATSSPPQIIGMPWLSSRVENMLRI